MSGAALSMWLWMPSCTHSSFECTAEIDRSHVPVLRPPDAFRSDLRTSAAAHPTESTSALFSPETATAASFARSVKDTAALYAPLARTEPVRGRVLSAGCSGAQKFDDQ